MSDTSSPSPPPSRRSAAGAVKLAISVLSVALLAVVGIAATREAGWTTLPSLSREDPPAFDPFVFDPSRASHFERRATIGLSHVLYERSPGGAIASARRTARWRKQVEAAAAKAGQDPDLLEALVFLESAGRPEAIAGDDPESAVGLAQILAETGQSLLRMRVDLERSRELTKRIRRAEARGKLKGARELRRLRRRADERFDPEKALAAAGRYLVAAEGRFGREDLSFASYHMGMGNLENVIRAYTGESDGSLSGLVRRSELTYAHLYFDTSPVNNPRPYRILNELGDDTSNYWWKLLASREIMRLHRSDPDELERLSDLHGRKATAEEVFHPEEETEVFEDPGELEQAWFDGKLITIPNAPSRLWLRRARQMGELAEKLDKKPDLYQGLRPEALATLIYIADRVQAISGRRESLVVTSGVRDREYQQLLIRRNIQATRKYSVHTTGYAFDIWRKYRSRAQSRAFQHVLDRLRALAIIDYAREPAAIHIAVSKDAHVLLPVLGRRGGE